MGQKIKWPGPHKLSKKPIWCEMTEMGMGKRTLFGDWKGRRVIEVGEWEF